MAAVISFLIIFVISISIVKVASIMLKLTGMSEDMARFQARSAFTGTGFTTGEAESIVRHPVRRRIIMNLMFMGNVGIVSFVSTLILTFTTFTDQRDIALRLGIIVGAVLFMLMLSRIGLVDWILSKIVHAYMRRFTRVYAHDYDSLLFLGKDYEVIKFAVGEGAWLAERSLGEARLNDEGLLVLGIQRTDGYYLAVPRGETLVYSGDEIIVYGREEGLKSLATRSAGTEGEREHVIRVEAQKRLQGLRTPGVKDDENDPDSRANKSWLRRIFRRRS
jgi:type III secretory pathway component EscS